MENFSQMEANVSIKRVALGPDAGMILYQLQIDSFEGGDTQGNQREAATVSAEGMRLPMSLLYQRGTLG